MDKVNSRQVATLWLTAFATLLMYAFPPIGRETQSGNVTPKGFGYLGAIPSDLVIDYKRLIFQVLVLALLAACLMISNRGPFTPKVMGSRLLFGLVVLAVGGGLLTMWLQYAPVEYPGRSAEWLPRNRYSGNARLVVSLDIEIQLLVGLLLGSGVYLILTAFGSRPKQVP